MKKVLIYFFAAISLTGLYFAYYDKDTGSVCADTPLNVQIDKDAIIKANSANDLVCSPCDYLNKNVKFEGKFATFTVLGLDYPPALRKSEDYVGLLVFNDNPDSKVPLSELKMFLKRSEIEKYTDLKAGDKITVTGYVFSNALGDVWMDIRELKPENVVVNK